MLSDLQLIFTTWLTLFLWQLVSFPFLYKLYAQKTIDAAWGFGRLAVWLIISVIIWFLAHLGLPVNQPFFVYAIFLGLSVYASYYIYHKADVIKKFFKKNWLLILVQELIFFIFFAFLIIVRGYQPRVEGLEKFMDVGFMAGYLRSPTLPAEDIWLAGELINYYTFGHFMGAVLTQFWNIGVEYSYNILLGVIMGITAVQSSSLLVNLVAGARQLLGRHDNKSAKNLKILNLKNTFNLSSIKNLPLAKAAIIGGFLLVLAGNGHTTWFLLKNKSFEGYWYPDATRFIENTIHEFPAYSFIVSDLHAHVWSMPLVLAIILNIYLWIGQLLSAELSVELEKVQKSKKSKSSRNTLKDKINHSINKIFAMTKIHLLSVKSIKLTDLVSQRYVGQSIILGFLFGLAICTSTWDFLVYGLLLSVTGLFVLVLSSRHFIHLVWSAVLVLIMAVITASPWLLNFESISEGFRLVEERSPLWQIAVL